MTNEQNVHGGAPALGGKPKTERGQLPETTGVSSSKTELSELRWLRGLVAERDGHGGDIPVWLALEWIDDAIKRAKSASLTPDDRALWDADLKEIAYLKQINAGLYKAIDTLGLRLVSSDQLRSDIQRLQRALQFWLPGVPADDDEIAERVGNDAMLLVGYQGDDDGCAESLGWIHLRTLSTHPPASVEEKAENRHESAEATVKSEWRDQELWWCINGDWISDRDLRNWCSNNMGDNPSRHVDVVRKCHVKAYAAYRKNIRAIALECAESTRASVEAIAQDQQSLKARG